MMFAMHGSVREDDGRRRQTPLLLLLGLLVLFGLTATKGIASTDDHASAVEGWRIASAGNPWLEGVVAGLDPDPWLHEVPNGHVVADRMIGPAFICVPFYLLFHLGSGAQDFWLVPAGLASATTLAFAGLLMFLALRRLGESRALLAALAFAVATPTWSVSANSPWTHTVTQFGLAGAAFAASRGRWWLVGVFLAVGVTGRPHLAVVALVLGVGVTVTTRSLTPMVQVGVPSLLGLAGLALVNHGLFGAWAVTSVGYAGHAAALLTGPPANDPIMGSYSYPMGVAGLLFSPDRGVLVWTPVLLVLAPGLWVRRRQVPAWAWFLALGGVTYTALQLQLDYFGGGDHFYGYRIALELITCVTPALAFASRGAGRWTLRAAGVLIGLQAAAISVGATSDGYFVVASRVWHDNSLLMALREHPVPVSSWLLLCAAAGLMLVLRAEDRLVDASEAGAAVLAMRREQLVTQPAGYGRAPDPVD